ncbi:hypothetical protein Q6346_12030 [Isoptericola sp. b490]|uniref:hypothetical protein n=1 Tax=Actinotalea lenta TaxID=3064654 RepID=UPI00271293F1|nr:hypothetical protein [Isoptericola sp. b490]MDO8122039.1 hypothetical protein [Isoptericola sp. b490]
MSDGITVRGGAGGVTAQIEELEALAAALGAAAHALATAVADRASAGTALVAAPALTVLDGPAGLVACEREARALGAGLRGVAVTYQEADTDVTVRLRAVASGMGHAWGELGPVSVPLVGLLGLQAASTLVWLRLSRWTPTPWGGALLWVGHPAVAGRSDPLGAIGRLLAGPGLLPRPPVLGRGSVETLTVGMSSYLHALLPGRQPVLRDPVPAGAGLLAGLAAAAAGPGRLVVTAGPHAVPAHVPHTEADVLSLVADQYAAAAADGLARVAVQRLEHADGSRSWVVAVPGTETWATGGANPLDALTDLELTAGVRDDVTALVTRAMDQAGVSPGEPVLLAGHSLGGMAVARIAADPVLARRYTVAGVLTAGSPVAGYDVPARTQVLQLEHAQDIVPGLRGLPDPDRVNRTTVVRDLGASADATERVIRAPGAAHALDRYRRTAELLPAADPSVQGFRRATARVLGRDVVAARTWTFTGVRVPAQGCRP